MSASSPAPSVANSHPAEHRRNKRPAETDFADRFNLTTWGSLTGGRPRPDDDRPAKVERVALRLPLAATAGQVTCRSLSLARRILAALQQRTYRALCDPHEGLGVAAA